MLVAGVYNIDVFASEVGTPRSTIDISPFATISALEVIETADGTPARFNLSFRINIEGAILYFQEGALINVRIGNTKSGGEYADYSISITSVNYQTTGIGLGVCDVSGISAVLPLMYNAHTRIVTQDSVSGENYIIKSCTVLKDIAKANNLKFEFLGNPKRVADRDFYLIQASKPDIYFIRDIVDNMAVGDTDFYLSAITADNVLIVGSYNYLIQGGREAPAAALGVGEGALQIIEVGEILQDTSKSNPNGGYGTIKALGNINGSLVNLEISARKGLPVAPESISIKDNRVTKRVSRPGYDVGNPYGGEKYYKDKAYSAQSREVFGQTQVEVVLRNLNLGLLIPVELNLPGLNNSKVTNTLLSGGRYLISRKSRLFNGQGIVDALTLSRASFNFKLN